MILSLLLSPALGADMFTRWPEHTERDGFGNSYGIAVADINGDGWTDVVVPRAATAWLNDGATGWIEVSVPPLGGVNLYSQYGASLGDYDGDGLPDLSTEPRTAIGRLMHNEGGGVFVPLPQDQFPGIRSQSAETNAWGDVDGDGLLDLFVPAYYGDSGMYMNLGPDPKTGDYLFDEVALDVGIELSVTSVFRPEGAQLADVDRDGDADLYVCGELLRNESIPGVPWFETDVTVGIIPAFDEGAAFADIDMDGDLDLGVLYHDQNWDGSLPYQVMLVWENLGDSTYTLRPPDSVEDIDIRETYNLGMSWVDWDHDGDMDLTFSGRFETNNFRQTGDATFTRITSEAAQTLATPGWFDWDYDGDLDIALGVWAYEAQFFQNVLYDGVDPAERRYLRVRPVTPSAKVPQGLDTEFGATVEVVLRDDPAEVRRRNFVASGHGYLNQSEYTLTFGFEDAKAPVADVVVDFPNPGVDGAWRVDRHVNPALGDLDVLALADREVRVYRDGRAVVDGVEYAPTGGDDPLLQTPGGIQIPTAGDDLTALGKGAWVGVEITVPLDKADPEHGAALREVLVDGILDAPVSCKDVEGNVLIWDVTDKVPVLRGGATGAIHPANRRVDVPTDFELPGGRTYRVAARVSARRALPIGDATTWVEVGGGFELAGGDPCDPSFVGGVVGDPAASAVTVRYRDRQVPPYDEGGDTGDTADTADTGVVDTEDTHDTDPGDTEDTGPVDSDPTVDSGIVDTGEDGKGGCGCAAAPATGGGWLALLGVAAWRRRRRSPAGPR